MKAATPTSSIVDESIANVSKPKNGAVTRTEFGRLNIGERDSDSGCSGGSPPPKGFLAEDAEREAGCEMALDIEKCSGRAA